MGWTLFACFGCATHKRKRHTKASKLGPKIRRIQGYQQLQSDVPEEVHDATSDKPRDGKQARIRKKVRFNLDVISYEPISDYDTSYLQEDAKEEYLEQDEKAAAFCLVYAPAGKGGPAESTLSLQSVSGSYRYSNWYADEDNYDEDENEYEDGDGEYELSDLSDDDEDEADDSISNAGVTDEHRDLSYIPLISSSAGKGLRSSDDHFRRNCAVQVLKPIENLSQWKAVKARKR